MMSDDIETIEHSGCTIHIRQDPDPHNPRTDSDTLGKMVCFHKRYTLGDKKEFDSPEEFDKFWEKNQKKMIVLPMYMYDHSGITVRTYPFTDGWDSGQIGYIYVCKERAREWMNWVRITPARLEKLKEYLRGEVEEYDQYLRGDIYGYVVESTTGGYDSCWGYYGRKAAIEEAIRSAEYIAKEDEGMQFKPFGAMAETATAEA